MRREPWIISASFPVCSLDRSLPPDVPLTAAISTAQCCQIQFPSALSPFVPYHTGLGDPPSHLVVTSLMLSHVTPSGLCLPENLLSNADDSVSLLPYLLCFLMSTRGFWNITDHWIALLLAILCSGCSRTADHSQFLNCLVNPSRDKQVPGGADTIGTAVFCQMKCLMRGC